MRRLFSGAAPPRSDSTGRVDYAVERNRRSDAAVMTDRVSSDGTVGCRTSRGKHTSSEALEAIAASLLAFEKTQGPSRIRLADG
jgi:hypothetical protein